MLAINQTTTPSRPSHEESDIEGISQQDLAHHTQQVLNTNPGGELDMEEIPRPDLQSKQHVWNPTPMFINTTPWKKYAAFISLATFDMAMNAAAGCAAATIGAKMNHKLLTPQVLQLGALAGVTKAGITSFRELVLMSPVNFVFRMLLLFMFSSFGICLVLTAEVCNIVLGETPKELLIAAVVAAIPLIFESVRDLEPKPDQEGNTDYISRPVLSIFLLASNPLGGYVFARMAANQGILISNYPAACSAGVVYAIISFLSRTITACITCIQTTRNGTTRNVFGRYEWYQPEPVVLTEEEYRRINQMFSKTMERAFGRVTRLARTSEGVRVWVLRVLARLTCCFWCVEREVRKEAREKLREKAGRQRDVTVGMEEWAMEMRGSAVEKFPALEA